MLHSAQNMINDSSSCKRFSLRRGWRSYWVSRCTVPVCGLSEQNVTNMKRNPINFWEYAIISIEFSSFRYIISGESNNSADLTGREEKIEFPRKFFWNSRKFSQNHFGFSCIAHMPHPKPYLPSNEYEHSPTATLSIHGIRKKTIPVLMYLGNTVEAFSQRH